MTRRRFAIRVEDAPKPADDGVVLAGLLAYNAGKMGPYEVAGFSVYLRDGGGAIVGGLVADVLWRWLYVRDLWLDEGLRRRGWGTKLLAAAERHAFERGCRNAWLDTFSFQARGFYERCGYEVFGTLDDFPPPEKRYFLRKRLDRPRGRRR